VKIVERLTKGESKKKKRKKSHEASYILVEVGGTSIFVTHDVTKVEVRWAEIHLKLKSHAPKESGRLTPRTSMGLSAAQGQHRPRAGPAGPGQGLGLAMAQGGAWPWPWFRNFFINFFRIFYFPYVLHFSFGVSCCAHVLV
jgi:hypothetical protein